MGPSYEDNLYLVRVTMYFAPSNVAAINISIMPCWMEKWNLQKKLTLKPGLVQCAPPFLDFALYGIWMDYMQQFEEKILYKASSSDDNLSLES